MRMDMVKTRYDTFDELYEYCYRVAGTVGLMTMPVMGVDPSYKGPVEAVYRAALALGTANQVRACNERNSAATICLWLLACAIVCARDPAEGSLRLR